MELLETDDAARTLVQGRKGWISVDAPLSRALLKKAIDDEVMVEAPGGVSRWFIVDVRYGPGPLAEA